MPPIFQHALNAALKFLEKRIAGASDKISTSVEALAKVFSRGVSEQTRSLDMIGRRFEKAVDKIADPQFDVIVDFAPLKKELVAIGADVRKLVGKETAETKNIEALLKMILSAVKENAPEKIGEKIDAMDAVFKGLKPRDSVKFDEDQMRNLMGALTGGSSIGTNPGLKSATNWETDRLALTSANTQYSYTFPSNTVSWTFKLRTPGASLFYSSATGKLPVSGDASTYMTMLPMGARSQDGVEWGGVTMYFETDTASQVVELEIFTM